MATATTRNAFNRAVGKQIKARRGARPRWRIAADAGLSPDTIGRYERGQGSPNLDDAFRIAAALGCQVSDLIPADVEPEVAA